MGGMGIGGPGARNPLGGVARPNPLGVGGAAAAGASAGQLGGAWQLGGAGGARSRTRVRGTRCMGPRKVTARSGSWARPRRQLAEVIRSPVESNDDIDARRPVAAAQQQQQQQQTWNNSWWAESAHRLVAAAQSLVCALEATKGVRARSLACASR